MVQTMPKRAYGKTGVQMPVFSLGGAYALQDPNNKPNAIAMIREAIEAGVYYLDTARNYRASEQIFGEAIAGMRHKVFLSTKSDARDYDGAMRDLQTSLKNLRTDTLDQWIVHHVSYPHEVERLFAKDGALKAFEKAKAEKVVRFIGVSGHNDPQVLKTMPERFPFDMVLFPLNPSEVHHPRSFTREFLPFAQKLGIGLAVMKVVGLGRLVGEGKFTAAELLHYALSYPIHTAVIVPGDMRQLRELIEAARTFKPLPPETMRAMEQRAKPFVEQVAGVYHNWP